MLIDTNVWSELARRHPAPQVLRWIAGNLDNCILSTVVQAEMQYGIAKNADDKRRLELAAFHDDLVSRIADRVSSFDTAAAIAFGRLRARLQHAGKLIGERDMLIAAHALALDMPIVTRNVADMKRTGATIINPWDA